MTTCRIDLRCEPEGLPAPSIDTVQQIFDRALIDDDSGPCSVSILVVDAKASDHLHQTHFDISGATDAMTFPDGSPDPSDGRIHLGDIAICADVAHQVIAERLPETDPTFPSAVNDELVLYALHGLLHLLGFDDQHPDDLAEMWARQVELLAGVGIHLDPEPQ